jgi:hypothetical protein
VLVVEDTVTTEMRRFFVVDAALQVGSIEVSSQKQDFDPQRFLKFFGMVENQLHEFSSKYPESFRYMPRRAYDYLRTPPILGEIYQGFPEYSDTSWFIDQFFTYALLGIGKTQLPWNQQETNIQKAKLWTETPPFSPRLYHVQEMRFGHQSSPGWACILRAKDLKSALGSPNRNDLLDYVSKGYPVFIEVEETKDLDDLLEWLVFLKEAGVQIPNTILSVNNHREWKDEIVRLLDIPNSKILTSGSTITSLSLLTNYLKEQGESWSSRLIFASSYPETQMGESLSEILSFLLSKGLNANPEDLQRILGGNLLAMLPSRPDFLKYIDNDSAVAAEGLLGKTSMNELSRILRILAARGIQAVVSCDFMTAKNGAEIDYRSAVLSVKEASSNWANSMGILSERGDSLKVAGWKRSFTDNLTTRRSDLLLTLIRAAAQSSGPLLDSPSQLNRFNYALLECLKVRNPHEILSALHFEVRLWDGPRGTISISPQDLRALEADNDQMLIALEATTGQWWAGQAVSDQNCPDRTVMVSKDDAEILGIEEPAVIDLAKYEGQLIDLEEVNLAFEAESMTTSAELMAYVHLHYDEITAKIDSMFLGRGTILNFGGPLGLKIQLENSDPPLDQGQIGVLYQDRVNLSPSQMHRPANVVLCVSTDSSMQETDIELRAAENIRRGFSDLKEDIEELETFLNGIDDNPTRSQIIALAALMVLHSLSSNRTDGRFALVTFSDRARKFSVQKSDRVLNLVEFASDFSSKEVMVSLVYSILDTLDETGGKLKIASAYRSIAELLEELGQEKPTLVIVLTSGIIDDSDESQPFIRAIAEMSRYQLDIFSFDRNVDIEKAKAALRGLNARILPVRSFSGHIFDGYLMDAFDRLLEGALDSITEHDLEGSR